MIKNQFIIQNKFALTEKADSKVMCRKENVQKELSTSK